MAKDFKLLIGTKLKGNTIDNNWYKHLTLKRGNETIPNANAIIILGEIVYWYRATEIENENGSIEYKKKFKHDLLQKSYSELCDKFGFTKNQVKAATDYLEKKGLIIKEFRNIFVKGVMLSNVLFIGLNIENLLKISTEQKPNIPKDVKKPKDIKKPKDVKKPKEDVILEKDTHKAEIKEGGQFKSTTYTKTTTKTTKKKSNHIESTTSKYSGSDLDLILKQCELDTYSINPELKASLQAIIIKLYTDPKIANELRVGLSNDAIRLTLKGLRLCHIDEAIARCRKYGVKSKKYFMKALISVIQEVGIDDYVEINKDNEPIASIPRAIKVPNMENFEQRKYSTQEYENLENKYIERLCL